MWFIVLNKETEIYTLVDKEHLRFYKDSVLVQEIDGNLTDSEARREYIEFLEMIFPVTK